MSFRKLKKTFLFFLLGIVVLIILALVIINLPFTNRFVTGRVNTIFTNAHLPISIHSIERVLPNSVAIDGVYIFGVEGDTIIYAEEVKASIKIFALLRREVIIPSAYLSSSSVKLSRRNTHEKINIATTFTKDRKKKAKNGKDSWEVSVGCASISGLKFHVVDSVAGIFIEQEVGSLNLETQLMSIREKTILIKTLEIKGTNGSVRTHTNQGSEKSRESRPWNFGLSNLSLENIDFHFDDQGQRIALGLSLEEGIVKTRKSNIRNRSFDIRQVSLSGVNTFLQTDQEAIRAREGSVEKFSAFPWDISCKSLELDEVSLGITAYDRGLANYSNTNFGIKRLAMNLTDIELDSLVAGLVIKKMSFDFNNGFSVQETKGKLDSRAGTTLLNLHLETGNSLLTVASRAEEVFWDLISGWEGIEAATTTISESQLSLKDLAYFKHGLLDPSLLNTLAEEPFYIDGQIRLADSALMLSSVSISRASSFSFTAEGEIKDSLQFGISDINTLWLAEILDGLDLNYELPDFTYLAVEGSLSGSFRSPDMLLELKSNLGNIDLSASYHKGQDSFRLASQFDWLRLDRILNNRELGYLHGSGEISGNGIRKKSITGNASLMLDSLMFKGYNYGRGKIDFKIRPQEYDFSFTMNDPACEMDLTAGIILDSALAIYTKGSFMAKTNELNLLEDTLVIEGSLDVDLNKKNNSVEAGLILSDLRLTTTREEIVTGPLNASIRSDTLRTSLSGQSGFFNLDFQVDKPVDSMKTIIPAFTDYFASFLDSLTMTQSIQNSNLPGMHAKLDIQYHPAFDVFLNGLYIKDIDLELINNPLDERLQLTVLGRDVQYKMMEFETLNSRLTDSAGVIDFKLAADSSKLFSHPGNKLLIRSRSADWESMTKISILDGLDELVYDLEIHAEVDSSNFYVTVPSRQLLINRVPWQMDSENLLSYNYLLKRVSPKLEMHTASSSIRLASESGQFENLIKSDLENLHIGSLLPENIVTGNPGGQISGSLSYSSKGEENKEINSSLVISDLSWSDLHFNNLNLELKYKTEKPDFWMLEAYSSLDSAEIQLKGEKTGDGNLSYTTEIRQFPIRVAQPFVKDILTELDGFASGNFNVSSHEEIKDMHGELNISQGYIRVNTLNSAYKIPEEKISFDGEKILLDNFTILDSTDNKLLVNGFLDVSDPSLILTELDIMSTDLQVMNRDEKDHSSFYGQIYINSRMSVNGPLPTPDLKGRISLTGKTEVFYSKEDDLSLSQREKVITFVSLTPQNNQEVFALNQTQARISNSTVETLVEIDPLTRIHFNLSQNMYVIDLMIQGGGALNYSLLENNQTNLTGKYEIGEGLADVKITGWPNKQFQISQGGNVSWDGNIEDPILNLKALNKISSSYTNPIDGQIRNAEFNVILKLADRLSELDMVFTINTPDQYLMSIINTLSPEEQMRQAITILLFERIDLPGISTSTDYVTQQVNQILASQLNELTKTTIKGVDISFGIDTYTSASSTGGEQTNTSLSYDVQKAILNDRGKIEVSGRVNDYSNQQSNSNISLNNFSFEYQLDSSATKFIKVYNEHSYEDVFDGEVIKTGVGFIYRKSYPTLGDLLGRNKKKKSKKKSK